MIKNINLANPLSVETEELSFCPSCNSGELKAGGRGRDRLHRLSKQEFIYSQCNQCPLLFLSLRPLETEIQKFYPENYEPYKAEVAQGSSQIASIANSNSPHKEPILSQATKKLLRKALNFLNSKAGTISPDPLTEELQKVYKPAKQGFKLLDFGCGSDMFLNLARNQGWDTIGLDFSEKVVERVYRSGHKALLMSPKVWDEIEDESLYFVRMHHVLEHLYHPTEVLTAIKLKMKAGAILHIAVPNPQGISANIFGIRWRELDCPRHVILYYPSGLKSLLVRIGFQSFNVFSETLTRTFVGSLGYFMLDWAWIKHEDIEKMMCNQDLANVLYIPARFASAWGRADRFHIFVKK
jgi:2-polyprenyl-3-methyl-5-hydroxy-6-metoxy-1,4-benzoquinol methylase